MSVFFRGRGELTHFFCRQRNQQVVKLMTMHVQNCRGSAKSFQTFLCRSCTRNDSAISCISAHAQSAAINQVERWVRAGLAICVKWQSLSANKPSDCSIANVFCHAELPEVSPAMLTHPVEVTFSVSFFSSNYGYWTTAKPELLLLKVSPLPCNQLQSLVCSMLSFV